MIEQHLSNTKNLDILIYVLNNASFVLDWGV